MDEKTFVSVLNEGNILEIISETLNESEFKSNKLIVCKFFS